MTTAETTSCSAPATSSHLRGLLSSPLHRAPVAERLMRSVGVVPADPFRDLAPSLREVLEDVLPDTLFLETAEEALDDPVLFRRVGRDELLAHAIVPTGRPEAPTL